MKTLQSIWEQYTNNTEVPEQSTIVTKCTLVCEEQRHSQRFKDRHSLSLELHLSTFFF